MEQQRRFKPDTVYVMADDLGKAYSEEANDGKEYCYARSESYVDGSLIGDCWIQDEGGNIHPGYTNSPVPFNINDLLRYVA